MASCSRDSTLRVWSIAKIASAMQINILANRPLTQVVSSNLGTCNYLYRKLTAGTVARILIVLDGSEPVQVIFEPGVLRLCSCVLSIRI